MGDFECLMHYCYSLGNFLNLAEKKNKDREEMLRLIELSKASKKLAQNQ